MNTQNEITQIAISIFGEEPMDIVFAHKLERFAIKVAETERKKFEDSYLRLSMLHSEMLGELAETKRQSKMMSGRWWKMLMFWIKAKLKVNNE